MTLIASLIANPEHPVIDTELTDAASARLNASQIRILSPGVAIEMVPDHALSPDKVQQTLRDLCGDAPVDIAVQRDADRRKQVLVADMDSTMIDQECIDELAEAAGIGAKVLEITRRAMNGEIEFEAALRERAALLRGLPVTVIADVLKKRISPARGAQILVATMRRSGAHTALISGGFTDFAAEIGRLLNFHETQANRLEQEGGMLTGRVAEPILGRSAKRDAVLRIAAQNGLTPDAVLAAGDGANDLDMLEIAGMGVAIHAKPAVAAKARFRIDHGDLTALLYLQGYRRSEFAE